MVEERDDTWLYLHRGYLLPEHRSQGIGSAMLSWAEERIRQLVKQHGTARTAVIGANAMASEQDATALLLAAGYDMSSAWSSWSWAICSRCLSRAASCQPG
ncbi:hypothetical protein SBADM41S_01791 [Streptomyces badius]